MEPADRLKSSGDVEGVLVLLRGGGGGLGLIILAITVLGIGTWAFVTARLKQVKAGSAAWGQWLASASEDDLKAARARLGKPT